MRFHRCLVAAMALAVPGAALLAQPTPDAAAYAALA
jgi:hypothetical protein